MTQNLSTRRNVAVRSLLLAAGSLCFCFALLVSPAVAQHGGGGGAHGMVGGGGMGSMPGDRGMRPDTPSQPMSQSMSSSRQQSPMGLQLGLGGRWWDEHKTAKKLELNPDQQRRMDSIFEANKPTLTAMYSNLQREQAHLAALPPGDLQDESKVFAAIDRVSQARSDLEKEYAHTMLQIRQQLDPQQLQALDREIASAR